MHDLGNKMDILKKLKILKYINCELFLQFVLLIFVFFFFLFLLIVMVQGDKVRVVQTLLFVEGINTLLQTLFGTRLPTVVGGSYAFMVPIISIIHDPSLASIEDNHVVSLYSALHLLYLIEAGFHCDAKKSPSVNFCVTHLVAFAINYCKRVPRIHITGLSRNLKMPAKPVVEYKYLTRVQ